MYFVYSEDPQSKSDGTVWSFLLYEYFAVICPRLIKCAVVNLNEHILEIYPSHVS